MKTTLVFLVLITVTGAAAAANSFASRVREAKAVEMSPLGKAYQPVLWQQIGRYTATVMQKCFPTGSKPDVQAFTVVANILPNGTLARGEVQPKTAMSGCFLAGFEHAPFPAPPQSVGERGMPIEIDMTVKP